MEVDLPIPQAKTPLEVPAMMLFALPTRLQKHG